MIFLWHSSFNEKDKMSIAKKAEKQRDALCAIQVTDVEKGAKTAPRSQRTGIPAITRDSGSAPQQGYRRSPESPGLALMWMLWRLCLPWTIWCDYLKLEAKLSFCREQRFVSISDTMNRHSPYSRLVYVLHSFNHATLCKTEVPSGTLIAVWCQTFNNVLFGRVVVPAELPEAIARRLECYQCCHHSKYLVTLRDRQWLNIKSKLEESLHDLLCSSPRLGSRVYLVECHVSVAFIYFAELDEEIKKGVETINFFGYELISRHAFLCTHL